MSILITGGSGFIGWHLARLLRAEGHAVRALVRPTSKISQLEALGVEPVVGDVTDPGSLLSAIAGAETVFHLAGMTKALRRDDLGRVNAEGTANVARICADAQVGTLVCASSLAAAGPAPSAEALTEDCHPNPVSDYGRSKLEGERAARKFASRLPISIVRPPIVIGEYDPAALEMFKSIKRLGLHVVPGFRNRPFSIIHAEDLSRILIAVANRGERLDGSASGKGIYFAECERRPTYREIGDLIASSIQRRCLKLPVGPRVLRLAGFISDRIAMLRGQAAYFSSDKVREATNGPWICSDAKARQELGFTEEKSLEERFKQTGAWYLANGWL